jgi:hypothetical protein
MRDPASEVNQGLGHPPRPQRSVASIELGVPFEQQREDHLVRRAAAAIERSSVGVARQPVVGEQHHPAVCVPEAQRERHARTPCTHAMHARHARTPCTHAMHARHARTPCTHAMHARHARTPCTHAMHARHAHTCVPDAKREHAALSVRPRNQAAPCHLGRRGQHGQGTEQPRARTGHLRRAGRHAGRRAGRHAARHAARRAARRAGAPLLDRGRTRPHAPPLAPLRGWQQHRIAQRVELRAPPAAAAHEVVGPPPRDHWFARLVGGAAPVAVQRGVAEEGRVLVPGKGGGKGKG